MLNEVEHIAAVVADLARQDFGGTIELIVADGGSVDDSVATLEAAASAHEVPLVVLDNPERWVSHALNRCIAVAKGDLLIRIDCHSRYPADYVRRCVAASEATGAENVGGVFVPAGHTLNERAAACATDSPFGGIHWTRHSSDERVEVDTVPYGAFRPQAFELAGLFDETLVRNQDDEFNLRLRRAGGRIVLDPAIRVLYTPRGRFSRLFRQYYEYGLWKPAVMLKHGSVVSARSLAPGAFVASFLLLPLAPFVPFAGTVFALEALVYGAAALGFGALGVRRRNEAFRILPRVVAVFPTIHVAYGLGMLRGWLRAARRRSTPVTVPSSPAS